MLRNSDDTDWLREGDLIVNKPLAKTLRNIKENGTKDFYEGELARDIVKYIQNNKGNYIHGNRVVAMVTNL